VKIFKRIILTFVILMCGVFMLAGVGALLQSDHLDDKPFIGEIVIENGIYNSKPILDQVKRLREEKLLSGVLVRIESPGGAIGTSQEIYRSLLEFREDSIPVVVSMGNIAASGGLYCSLAAEKVFALPGSITGSIGVISQFPEATLLLDKVGVKFHTVKTGELKDAGSPFRPVRSEDLEAFDRLLQEMFSQFVEDVAKERGLSVDSVRSLADGSVFSGRQGVEKGLVDTLGTWHEALSWIKQRAKLDADAPVRNAKPPRKFWERVWDGPAEKFHEVSASWRGGPAWLTPGY